MDTTVWRFGTVGLALCLGRGPVAERPADLPLMSERVDDPTQPPAMFVGDRGNLPSTNVGRLPKRRVGVIDDQQSAAGRAADG